MQWFVKNIYILKEGRLSLLIMQPHKKEQYNKSKNLKKVKLYYKQYVK